MEKLTNKMEAVRRALDELGKGAMPTAIQEFVKRRFAVDISAKVASIYKSKITKGKPGRPGRKPKGTGVRAEAAPRAQDVLSFKDLRAVKELKDRLGPAGLRQLLELMCP